MSEEADPKPTPESEIAEAVKPYLEDGQRVKIRRRGDEVRVRFSTRPESKLKGEHPDLYGALSRANQQIDDSWGCSGFLAVPLFLVVGLIVVEMMGLIEIADGRGFITYCAAILIGVTASSWWSKLRQRAAYRSIRGEVVQAVRIAGIPVNTLVTRLEDEDELSDVAEALRGDRDLSNEA